MELVNLHCKHILAQSYLLCKVSMSQLTMLYYEMLFLICYSFSSCSLGQWLQTVNKVAAHGIDTLFSGKQRMLAKTKKRNKKQQQKPKTKNESGSHPKSHNPLCVGLVLWVWIYFYYALIMCFFNQWQTIKQFLTSPYQQNFTWS